MTQPKPLILIPLFLLLGLTSPASGQIARPHAQSTEPGPAKTVEQALEAFEVPEGFHVQNVAHEPMIINPVAMTWDDKGRILVCESVEYPRFAEGEGEDRVRIHIDHDNDGRTDEVKTFADGLNIPSGIEVGYGGVFVANAPDLLFFKDTDGDDVADTREVLLTGFGRKDTHEVPNNLIWGPDGWLYGLNGVFNPSRIENQGEVYEFTCALWRYHPVSKRFELFSEGTSNPWGLDYNRNGHWFVSACVIDHLWHLTQTGYYHRQGGPYPPNTWKIESIVDFKHQKAAYCGLCYYDADSYPEEYRDQLFMGNIHFGGINRDSLERNGSTYEGGELPDFMAGNDVWHMPVSQKIGPDGSLWILDWYDRYHCFQDALRDSKGIDRLSGRIWRVVYGDTPMPKPFDLQSLSNEKLIAHLSNPNVWWRRKARRILTERNDLSTVELLKGLVHSEGPNNGPTEALWTLMGMNRIDEDFQNQLLEHANPGYRAWGVHAAAERGRVSEAVFSSIQGLARDENPDVRLQVAIASSRIPHPRAFDLLLGVMEKGEEDPLIPHIVWENLHHHLQGHETLLVNWMGQTDLSTLPITEGIIERSIGLLLDRSDSTVATQQRSPVRRGSILDCLPVVGPLLFQRVGHEPIIESSNLYNDLFTHAMARIENNGLVIETLDALWSRIQSEEIEDKGRTVLSVQNQSQLTNLLIQEGAVQQRAAWILAAWGDPEAKRIVTQTVEKSAETDHWRSMSLIGLALAQDESVLDLTSAILNDPEVSTQLKVGALNALGKVDFDEGGDIVVAAWDRLPQKTRAQALNLLTGRRPWAERLVEAVETGSIPKETLNVNTARRLVQFREESLTARVEDIWGKVRTGRDKDRNQRERHFKWVLTQGDSDPKAGMNVFKKACAQCHQIYGYGKEVGPDITENGRDGLDQILSNVLDPNLVIGSGYIAWTIWTHDEEIHTGILVENSDDRVVLKLEGDDQVIVPREDIAEMAESEISLMPEQLEEGLTHQEFRDLIAFLRTSEPPVAWQQLEEGTQSE